MVVTGSHRSKVLQFFKAFGRPEGDSVHWNLIREDGLRTATAIHSWHLLRSFPCQTRWGRCLSPWCRNLALRPVLGSRGAVECQALMVLARVLSQDPFWAVPPRVAAASRRTHSWTPHISPSHPSHSSLHTRTHLVPISYPSPHDVCWPLPMWLHAWCVAVRSWQLHSGGLCQRNG